MPWIKVVMHAHSTWSYDGHWSLDDIARVFGGLGIDTVMMSEHDTGFDPLRFSDYRAACASASTRRCRLIPGIEYSSPENDIHILTWGLDRFLQEHQPVIDTLQAVRDAGGVAILAHPARRDAHRKIERAWLPLLSGIEVWNRKTDGLTFGREALRLRKETKLPASVGCDFHRLKHYYPLTNRFEIVDAANLEHELVDALKKGKQQPCAFGKPIFDADGDIHPKLHDRLEATRKGLLAALRPLRS